MDRFGFLLSFYGFLAINGVSITVDNCGVSKVAQERITGGNQADIGEYPWMASLNEEYTDNNWIHTCGATVLNEDWVITSASCVGLSEPSKYEILVGLHNQEETNTSTVQRIKISRIVVHEDYDDLYENDIALLKTARPIDIAGSRGYVNGICLPERDEDPTGSATVIGWGLTNSNLHGEDDIYSDILKAAEVSLIDTDTCGEFYSEDEFGISLVKSETMICAAAENAYACFGDNGGPLFQIKRGVATLIGIVSKEIACGYHPGIYTKVSAYLDWIETVVSGRKSNFRFFPVEPLSYNGGKRFFRR
nr:venom protein [Lampona murina]